MPNTTTSLRPAMSDALRYALDAVAMESTARGRPLRLASEILTDPPKPPLAEPAPAWNRPWWVDR